MAFKATYANGLPAMAAGVIVNSKDETVDSIATQHDGMGFFYLEARQGETYTAKWSDGENNTYITALPAVKNEGAVLEIKPAEKNIGFIIRKSGNAPAAYNTMYIVATLKGRVAYMAPVHLNDVNIASGNIFTDSLPAGVLLVTLFDSAWQPVAERITYIMGKNYVFNPLVTFDTLSFDKRGKNVLTISVPDSIETNMANISVAVTDAGVGVDNSDDIVSHLLLTGDLKGWVYRPGYYFSDTGKIVKEHLDLVMLTNGWRRFKWNEALSNTLYRTKYPPDTTFLSLGGKIENFNAKDLQSAGKLFIVTAGKTVDTTKDFFNIPINADGSFIKPRYSFVDTLKVYYRFASKKSDRLKEKAAITFTSGALPSPEKLLQQGSYAGFNMYDTSGSYINRLLVAEDVKLAELLKQTTLPNVTVKSRIKRPEMVLDDRYTSGSFKGSGGNVVAQLDYTNDDFANFLNIFMLLKYKVPGLVIKDALAPTPDVRYQKDGVAFYIDEVEATVLQVSNMNAWDVAYIKVIAPSPVVSFYNESGVAALIAIYRRKGVDLVTPEEAKYYKIAVGYTYTKEFYAPDYGKPDSSFATADVRRTLYWNPLVLTYAGNRTVHLPFYNNDVSKKFRVIIEGVSTDGRLTRVEKVVGK